MARQYGTSIVNGSEDTARLGGERSLMRRGWRSFRLHGARHCLCRSGPLRERYCSWWRWLLICCECRRHRISSLVWEKRLCDLWDGGMGRLGHSHWRRLLCKCMRRVWHMWGSLMMRRHGLRCHGVWRHRLWGHGMWWHSLMMLWWRRRLVMRPRGSVMSELRWAGRLSHGVSSVGIIYRRVRNVREAILRRRRRRRRCRMMMLLRPHIGAHSAKVIPRRRPRNSLRLRGTVARSKHPIPDGRRSRRRMSDMLETGMTW